MPAMLNGFQALLPELYLAISSLFLLVYGVYRIKQANCFLLAAALLLLCFTAYLEISGFHGETTGMNGMFITDRFTLFAKLLLLLASGLVLLLSSGWLREEGGRPFEFIIIMLLSLLGMMLMVSANDMLSLYMGLELSSLGLYILASFTRDHAKSSEAGLKYFVLSALASGMLLFGISLVYGFAGSIGFGALGELLTGNTDIAKGVIVGLILIMVAFCFKLSAVPFHMWTPDVYEGAPTPVTAFFATAPKIAALALFARLLMQPFSHLFMQWQQVLDFVSIASMLVGALGAIMQTNIKRLMAYSSISHIGFMLMALAAGSVAGVQALLIYLTLYIFMSSGMFGCIMLMKREGKPVEDIKQLAGLSQTHPLLAIVIALFMFSLAGIPPMSGLFVKLYAVLAAIEGGLTWLAVAGVLTSVIGCYYYLKIVKFMYFDAAVAPFDQEKHYALSGVIALGAVVTLGFVLIPTPLIAQAALAAKALLHVAH